MCSKPSSPLTVKRYLKCEFVREYAHFLPTRCLNYDLISDLSGKILSFKNILLHKPSSWFPGSSAGKEIACNAGDPGSIPGSGRSAGEGIGYPLQYSCLENLHGQKSLAGYSSWGRKGLDMTERLSTAQQTTIHNISNDIAACLYFLYFSFSQSLWILLTPGRF